MTITELLNQEMPEGSYWETFIYFLEDEYRVCKSVVTVQRLLCRLTGETRVPTTSEMHKMFKQRFTG